MKLADAEAEASRNSRRNKELSSSLSVLQGESTTNERSRIKVTEVNAEIQELRREYQVRQRCKRVCIYCTCSATTLNTAVLVDHWLVWADELLTLICAAALLLQLGCMHTGVNYDTYCYEYLCTSYRLRAYIISTAVSSTTGTGSDVNDYVYATSSTDHAMFESRLREHFGSIPGFQAMRFAHPHRMRPLQHTSQLRTTAQRATTAKPRLIASLVV